MAFPLRIGDRVVTRGMENLVPPIVSGIETVVIAVRPSKINPNERMLQVGENFPHKWLSESYFSFIS